MALSRQELQDDDENRRDLIGNLMKAGVTLAGVIRDRMKQKENDKQPQ